MRGFEVMASGVGFGSEHFDGRRLLADGRSMNGGFRGFAGVSGEMESGVGRASGRGGVSDAERSCDGGTVMVEKDPAGRCENELPVKSSVVDAQQWTGAGWFW